MKRTKTWSDSELASIVFNWTIKSSNWFGGHQFVVGRISWVHTGWFKDCYLCSYRVVMIQLDMCSTYSQSARSKRHWEGRMPAHDNWWFWSPINHEHLCPVAVAASVHRSSQQHPQQTSSITTRYIQACHPSEKLQWFSFFTPTTTDYLDWADTRHDQYWSRWDMILCILHLNIFWGS